LTSTARLSRKKNQEFKELHLVFESISHQLRYLIIAEEEKALWDQGVLGTHCPKVSVVSCILLEWCYGVKVNTGT
jgi:hypothetical protein